MLVLTLHTYFSSASNTVACDIATSIQLAKSRRGGCAACTVYCDCVTAHTAPSSLSGSGHGFVLGFLI